MPAKKLKTPRKARHVPRVIVAKEDGNKDDEEPFWEDPEPKPQGDAGGLTILRGLNFIRWPQWARERPYESVLPVRRQVPGLDNPTPFKPKFGYMKPLAIDRTPKSPKIAFDSVIPAGVALRITYEECWRLQAEMQTNWIEFIAQQLLRLVMSLAEEVATAVTGGGVIPLFEILKTIKDAIDDYQLNLTVTGGFLTIAERIHLNAMPGKQGELFDDQLLRKGISNPPPPFKW